MKQLKLWLPVFVFLFLIFLISSFNFHSFNADWPRYLSEVICTGPSKISNCSLSAPLDLVKILRSPLSDPLQVYDYGIDFTSASFASFLALFSNVNDSLAIGLLKIHIVKSLIVAYITTVSCYLLSRFPNVKQFGYELIICVFTFPYTIFMASSVYTASISTIALMQILIIIKIFEVENHLSSKVVWILLGNFVAASTLILTNRFETTIFYVFAITLFCLQLWKHIEKRTYAKLIFSLSLGICGVFLVQNRELRNLILTASRRELKILNTETAGSSVVVDKVGDFGLTLTAPITFFDNSTRNLFLGTTDPGMVPKSLVVLIVITSWIPLIYLFSLKLFSLFRPLLCNSSSKRTFLIENYPALLAIFLLLFIPVYSRTIWFLHYAIPLLCVFLLFTDSSGHRQGSYRKLLGLGMLSNALTFYIVSFGNGTLYIGRYIFRVELQIGVVTAAGILLLTMLRYKALLERN
jgi:hypothetical protein